MNPHLARGATRVALLCLVFTLVTGHAAETVLSLKPAQLKALGLVVHAVPASGMAVSRYPGTVVIPAAQQRVVAAPLAGMVESLQASEGEQVRAGQALAVLRSVQAQELAREVLTADSQSTLAGAAQARDEQLYREGLIALSRLEASRAQARQAKVLQNERHQALRQSGATPSGGAITLTSPINGVVLARQAVLGQRVEQASPLFHVASLAPLWVEMQLPAHDAALVRKGDVVRVEGDQAQGQVIAIGHTVTPGGQSVLVRAELRKGLGSVRAGQAVEARLERAQPGVVQLPAAAVVDDAGQPAVFTEARSGQYRLTRVEVVSSSGGVCAVKGLPVGSKVVIQGTAALKALLTSTRP